MASKTKKLHKSKNKIMCGVIGGLGEYFDVDPTVLRLGFILLLILTGIFPAIIGYFLACFIVPEK